jgi:FkbH-like protein
MLDQPSLPAPLLTELRHHLSAGPPTLAGIMQTGAHIAAAAPLSVPDQPTQRIAVLGAVTLDHVSRAIVCAVVQEGVFPLLHQAPFGAYVQETLDPGSALHGFAPEIAVIAPDWRDLITALPMDAPAEAVDAALAPQVALFRSVWSALAAGGARILQHVLVPPAERYCGIAERLAPAAPDNQVRRLNERLLDAGRGQVHWIDLERLAAEIGTRRWSAPRFWHAARLDFDPRWLPDYMQAFRGAWRAANARTRKALVLDLDNTLWGGVIGDDGVAGIALGPGSAAGEAFASWQRTVKGLAARGVVLAVCSKNAPEVAATGFTHPASVLRREDFAAFDCAWTDKAGGLRRIARQLNLGLDSLVFADDNPAECALVARDLPEVAVVPLGADPARFPELLDAGHWFDLPCYTPEDLGRTAAYAARQQAAEAQAQGQAQGQADGTDIGAYLAGLAMNGRVYRPTAADIPRMAQLEQKTNQFNLTTRRYTAAALQDLLGRPYAIVLALRLADRFGDHGLVSTLIAIQEGGALRIDSWLMSCRVFARSAEPLMLRALIDMAPARGITRLVGEYRPTARNAVVAGLYPRLGFHPEADGRFVRAVAAGSDDLVTWIAAVP